MEPVLFAHAASIDGLQILNRTAFEDFSEQNAGIVATVRNLDNGTASQLHADFIVGCDGARSVVRKAIDANLQGTPIIQRVQSTYIHARATLLGPDGRARLDDAGAESSAVAARWSPSTAGRDG